MFFEAKHPCVLLEHPVKGDYLRNLRYLHTAMADSFERGEAPLASFELYRKVLDDRDLDQREISMTRGFSLGRKMDFVAVYEDLGISDGMQRGIHLWVQLGLNIEYRKIGLAWDFGPTLEQEARYTCRGCPHLKTQMSADTLDRFCTARGPQDVRTIPDAFRIWGGVPGFCPAKNKGTNV